jgi:hypothetical protein
MKIYVAGKFEEKEYIRKVMDELEAIGHTITHDWTKESIDGMKAGEIEAYFRDASQRDKIGVQRADLLLIFPHEHGKGQYTEMGIAMALSVNVVWVNNPEADNIFAYNHFVDRVDSKVEAFELIERYQKKLSFRDQLLGSVT